MTLSRSIIPLSVVCFVAVSAVGEDAALKPWDENPWYWSYHGEPVLLVSGSDDDNLFQWPETRLIEQLDRIASAGGNVVRNTMSDRRDGGFEVYPFRQLASGKYDLDQWNPIYWERFDRLLRETAKRKIFVQIEIWDRFDFTDNRASDPRRWQDHPYSPANNINYTFAESGFATRYPEHPGKNKQPFFFTTPEQRDNQVVLYFQKRFVNKLLDHALKHDHVLYCIDNETKADPQWGEYWARLIKQRAREEGKTVMVTEMWDDWDLTAERHRQTFDHPELYDYVDVSQNNHNRGREHWENFLYVRKLLDDQPRPMNTTKTYGADGNKFGHSDQDAIERFWRHLLGGAASVRFHRPPSGLGINEKAVACIRAARLLEAKVPLWTVAPADSILERRSPNQVYAASSADQQSIALFLPAREAGTAATNGDVVDDATSVVLNLDKRPRAATVHWFDIDSGTALEPVEISAGKQLVIEPPSTGNLAAAIEIAR